MFPMIDNCITQYYNGNTLLQPSVKNRNTYRMIDALCGGFVSGLVTGPVVAYEPAIKGVTFYIAATTRLEGTVT